jgi:hypothetical protein
MKKTPQKVVDTLQKRRREGAVYAELIAEFQLAKSTVSRLCQDVVIPDHIQVAMAEAAMAHRIASNAQPKTPDVAQRRLEGNRKGGLTSQASQARTRVKSPDTKRQVQESAMQRYRERRALAFQVLGDRCSFDGCQAPPDKVCLVSATRRFVHICGNSLPSFLAIIKSEFTVLCRSHEIKARRPLLHGTYNAYYKFKCRCDLCGEYRADYVLRRREDYRERADSHPES